jgi:hypothetical protein
MIPTYFHAIIWSILRVVVKVPSLFKMHGISTILYLVVNLQVLFISLDYEEFYRLFVDINQIYDDETILLDHSADLIKNDNFLMIPLIIQF